MRIHQLTSRIMHRGKQLIADCGGAAAVEFALIVPVLAGLVVAIDDVSNIAIGTADMQTGARAATQYAMEGGTDLVAARTLGMQAWNQKPSDASLLGSPVWSENVW